jgi:hypothetical protein
VGDTDKKKGLAWSLVKGGQLRGELSSKIIRLMEEEGVMEENTT